MHTLVVVLVAAAAACAIARPPGPSDTPALSQLPYRSPLQPPRRFLGNYLMPRLLLPNSIFERFDENVRPEPAPVEHEWLNKEIDRINQMEEEEESLTPFDDEFSRWMSQDPYMPRPYEGPVAPRDLPNYIPDSPGADYVQPLQSPREDIIPAVIPNETMAVKLPNPIEAREKKETFALTPLDKGYYEPEEKIKTQQSDGPHEGGQADSVELTPPRRTRQNPNLGRAKNLITQDLDNLRNGLTREAPEGTDKPRHIHVLESSNDPADSIYGIALIAAVGTALTMAIFGFAFGWYTLSKKAKAAADVDYPAYGVTGPTIDPSGDRKLAHSAHMYHYQHQKQQIIAMERNGLEQRNGSVSDPESEEENEEGDYTVYECPGFATTGEMEVKNPLFSEDPTPATPGKCELVKPQPKD
ncbi:uncharacterized protein LOC142986509 isoform X2 [Anticarsia gemmatalis]|uniref:uncharacterized protein LOC142986509 isoform X2 n=1 Tax=Anticarsia gemmatalis TaxID=129554 RepID=UPI003F77540E